MFTGIIEATVVTLGLRPVGAAERGARLCLAAPPGPWEVSPGESIAVSGCCVTLAGAPGPGGELDFDLSAETLERTWFAELTPGRFVNLERSMRLGQRLGGHLVSGHVDGVGRIVEIQDSGDGGAVFTFEVAAGLDRYLIEKGSVAVDGISLTVVEPRGRLFDVALIPVTLAQTSLGRARVGERVNIEADLVGKWIERLIPTPLR